MVRVADIIGALLRGLTTARIQSDIFSAQASGQYLEDDTLRNYPVPRAEIRQADVSMRMAVQETVQRNLDELSVFEQLFSSALEEYLVQLMGLSVPAASEPALVQSLADHLGDQQVAFVDELRASLVAYVEADLVLVKDGVLDNPKGFGSKEWRDQSIAAIEAAVITLAVDVDLGGVSLSKDVQDLSTPFIEGISPQIQLELALASAAFFDLDLAIKRDQIVTLPEHVMSEIKLQVVMENYEWASVTDGQGNTINRLSRK